MRVLQVHWLTIAALRASTCSNLQHTPPPALCKRLQVVLDMAAWVLRLLTLAVSTPWARITFCEVRSVGWWDGFKDSPV